MDSQKVKRVLKEAGFLVFGVKEEEECSASGSGLLQFTLQARHPTARQGVRIMAYTAWRPGELRVFLQDIAGAPCHSKNQPFRGCCETITSNPIDFIDLIYDIAEGMFQNTAL